MDAEHQLNTQLDTRIQGLLRRAKGGGGKGGKLPPLGAAGEFLWGRGEFLPREIFTFSKLVKTNL